MKNLLAALIFALFAQTANAQLAAEGLVIGLKRNETLAYIDRLSHGGARMACITDPDGDSALSEQCVNSSITGLTIEGHAVKELHMRFLAKRLAHLEVTFADRDLWPALDSLLAQMTKKLGEPTECDEEYGSCEWRRDGELEYDEQGIWGYENQECDDMYPVRDRRPPGSPRRTFDEIGRSDQLASLRGFWTECRIRSAQVGSSEPVHPRLPIRLAPTPSSRPAPPCPLSATGWSSLILVVPSRARKSCPGISPRRNR